MNLILLVALVLGSHEPRSLADYLARRDYDSAVVFYRPRAAAHDPSAMRDLARVYAHDHQYDSSAVWWERALTAAPDNDSAVAGRWLALYRRDEADSTRLPTTKSQIAAEAQRYVQGTSARELALAYDGFALADSAMADSCARLLTAQFPDSPRGYQLIGSMFYDSLYPVWSNDTLKIPIIRRFLGRYPRSEWRQTFYTFLLSSLFGLKDTSGLLHAAAEMTQDDSLDPFRYRYAAGLINRMKLAPSVAESYARRAIALEPGCRKPANKPEEQWALEYPVLYGQARVALAEALMAEGRLADARGWLDEALARFQWDPNSEWTPAPFHCLLAEIAEKQSDTARAMALFAQTLEDGDSRNTWTVRADSGFKRLRPWTGAELRDWHAAATQYTGPVFADVTESLGLADRRESRVVWGDYDNDGYQDLLLNGSVLFRNDSGRRFTNVTDSVGLAKAGGRGGLFADFTNDGWPDLYVAAAEGGARFYKNDSGRFVNLSDRAGGPGNNYPTEGAGWADFDNDGWLDLYCANYENWEKHTYYPDQLFQNQQGHLVDVTAQAGMVPPHRTDLAGRGVNWADFDNDGWQDCFVSNYRLCENFLWVNHGDGTFTDQAAQLGVAGDEVDGWYGHTIGSAWADYDNDGDLDLFTANLAHPRYIEFSNRSMLYNNLGEKASPRFVDCRVAAGIRYEETHSDPAWADCDNDGDLDLYVTSIYEGRRSFLYENQLVPSAGALLDRPAGAFFNEVTWLSGTRVFNGWGCAFADFDNDGDMDLAVGSGSGAKLFRNETRSTNHWLEVRVVGTKANRAGIGARVTVTQGRSRQIREVECGKGTTSQNSVVQHFGLGSNSGPVDIEVRFGPSSVVVRRGVRPDQIVPVKEAD